MTKAFLDRVYEVEGDEAKRALYDDWARAYDADLAKAGYATPGRIAAALAAHLHDRMAPLLDFGCGTGLSGEALAARGFSEIDGCDPSEGMLGVARQKGVYRNLWHIAEGGPLSPPRPPAAILACGVISAGAAPPATFDVIVPHLPPGSLLAVSYNSHTTADPAYMERLDRLTASDGLVRIFEEDGPHLPAKDLTSRLYIFQRPA